MSNNWLQDVLNLINKGGDFDQIVSALTELSEEPRGELVMEGPGVHWMGDNSGEARLNMVRLEERFLLVLIARSSDNLIGSVGIGEAFGFFTCWRLMEILGQMRYLTRENVTVALRSMGDDAESALAIEMLKGLSSSLAEIYDMKIPEPVVDVALDLYSTGKMSLSIILAEVEAGSLVLTEAQANRLPDLQERSMWLERYHMLIADFIDQWPLFWPHVLADFQKDPNRKGEAETLLELGPSYGELLNLRVTDLYDEGRLPDLDGPDSWFATIMLAHESLIDDRCIHYRESIGAKAFAYVCMRSGTYQLPADVMQRYYVWRDNPPSSGLEEEDS